MIESVLMNPLLVLLDHNKIKNHNNYYLIDEEKDSNNISTDVSYEIHIGKIQLLFEHNIFLKNKVKYIIV